MIPTPPAKSSLPSAALHSVLLMGLSTASLLAQDVQFAAVTKVQRYVQIGPKLVTLPDGQLFGDPGLPSPFAFEAFVESAGEGVLSTAAVTPPGGPALPLLEDPELTNEWRWVVESGEFAEFNASFPPGSYSLDTDGTNDGPKSVALTLTPDDYVGVTTFTVFEAAQAIDAAAGFTFTWDPIPGGSVDDPVFLSIENELGQGVYESPDLGEPGALTGLSTSAGIPGGTLSPGERYRVMLQCYRIVDSNESYAPGVPSLAGYGKILVMPAATTGVADSTAPTLEASHPYDFEENVATDAVVVFRFDEAMDTAVDPADAITWTGSGPGSPAYRWSPDGRTLFCNYGGGLPVSTMVTWELNAAGASAMLADAAGNPLGATSGGFSTGTSAGTPGPDVEAFEIGKARFYRQEAAGAPTPGHFAAGFFADLHAAGRLSSLDLGIPGRGVAAAAGQLSDDFWEVEGTTSFAEKADLDRIFPNGSYTVTLNTLNDGSQSVTLTTGPDDYPNPPTVTNFAATQAVDPTQPLTIQWQAMSGGTASDSIEVYVGNDNASFFESPAAGEPGALDGTATEVTIPAGALPPGRSLELEIVFIRVADTDDTTYPGVTGRAGYFSLTFLDLTTTGTPFEPRVAILGHGAGAQVQVTGERGLLYEVRTSTDLGIWNPGWVQQVLGDDDLDFRGTFEFPAIVGGFTSLFYQVEEVAPAP